MSKFNSELKKKLDGKRATASFISHQTTKQVQKPNTTNISGSAAHNMDKWLRLVSMLNTLKLQQQYYKTESKQLADLKAIVEHCAKEDALLVAKCIIYSRCIAEGLRSVNHAATVYLAPFLSGKEWAKRFYSGWDKRKQRGGTIFRTDDMNEIMSFYLMQPTNKKTLPKAMKQGFASVIEQLDLYNFGKYTRQIRDVANMVHPDGQKTLYLKTINDAHGYEVHALDYIMQGNNIPAHTWENAQSEAGQEVAKAIKAGKLTQTEAQAVLQEAKEANWNQLLAEGRLGILAALRNIRNILLSNPSRDTVNMLYNLFTDGRGIVQGKIMPYQIDLAIEVIKNEFNSADARRIIEALNIGYTISIPNLAELLTGNTLVIVDQSGSMWMANGRLQYGSNQRYNTFAGDKANLIAATIAKATKADVIRFGTIAEYVNYNSADSVFSIADSFKKNLASTNLEAAWKLAATSKRQYNRAFILSDYEINRGNTYTAYQSYINNVGNPYVYSCDLAAYGTTQLVGPKVHFLYGYGNHLFEQIKRVEFDPMETWERIKAIEI